MRKGTVVRVALKRRLISLRDGTHGSFERVANGVPLLSAKNISTGHLDISESESCISEVDYQSIHRNGYLKRGDILLSIVGSIGNAAVFDTSECVAFQRSVAVLRPDPTLLPRFLYYQLQSPTFQAQLQMAVKLSAQGGVYLSDLGEASILVHPPDVQEAIVGYLDRETGRLDALVAAKERVLGLLAEKRRALITQAVTRGLDSKARLRESGISWLGKIPAHWELKRAKWMFSERDERSSHGEETLLSLRMERGLVPHNEVSEKQTRPEELIGYKRTSPGEIVVNRMRAAIGLIAVAPHAGLVSPDYAVFIPVRGISVTYYYYLFTTELLGAVFRSVSTGMGTGSSGFLRLYSESFLALWLPHPPADEQRAIVEYTNHETAGLNKLYAATELTITLLKERRAALIAAAVTGQIDVRSVA